jgi:CRISPR-associated exonuclease Cas4
MAAQIPDKTSQEHEPVLISALNQYVFCPRRCALMHVEAIWSDNQHTMLGSLLHDRADEPGYETDGSIKILRALPLYSTRYGLTGLADVVEFRDDVPAPVEYKKGKRRKFENDEIQLCAQALCLEEMFCTEVSFGYIYHAASKRRREVIFDWRLREETKKTIIAVREMLASGRVPAAILAPRCDGCSLRAICLPELTGAQPSPEWRHYQHDLWDQG